MTTLPDAMGDINEWIINHPVLSPLHGGRVYFQIPDVTPAAPFIRMSRAGGSLQAGSTPLQDIRVTFEVWVTALNEAPSLRQLVAAMESVFFDLQSPTIANPETGDTTILNVDINAALDSPDPDTGWPRSILSTVFTVRNS